MVPTSGYSLMSAPPIVMLAALGGSWLLTRLGSAARQRRAALVALAAMAWMFLWQVPYVRAVGEEGWGARADVAFAREVSPTLPPDALVLTQDPNMFLLWGVDAAQLSLAGDPSFLENARRRHGDHVFLHWGFWCNVADPEQTRLCSDLLGRTPATLVRERHVRDYRFAFYRLNR